MKYLLLALTTLALFSATHAQKDSTQFVTTWRTYDSGLGGDSTVVIPIDTNYTYNFDIDWDNDGVFDDIGVTDTAMHTYSDTGTYTVRIKGVFPRYFTFPVNRKLIALEQWGNNAWLNMELMFVNLDSLTYNAVDTPNLTFITSLSGLFVNNRKFNSDISNWNVSRIKNMNYLFQGCTTFNQPLANWDVSNVVSMGGLFEGCRNFNQPLNNWVVDSVRNFFNVFRFTSFNQPLNNWNVENGELFAKMFEESPFNQPINNWDVSSAVNTSYMFRDNVAFNQPLDNWQVDSVTTMTKMFENSVFNQPLPSWNTSNVTRFIEMFRGNTVFNQDLGNWDIPSDFRSQRRMGGMLDNTNMSTANYDSTIIKWARQNEIGVELGALGLSYCLSDSIRNDLITNYFWTFTGDTLNCLGVGIDETSSLSEAGFSIYPNPTQGEFTLERNLSAKAKELFVYNMQGQLVYTAVAQNRKQQIDLSGFKSGIYLLRIGEESKRVVVQ